MQDYLNVRRTARSIMRDNVPEEVLSWNSCSRAFFEAHHHSWRFMITDSARNGFKRARIIIILDIGIPRTFGIVPIVNATFANYDGALAFNIQLLIAPEQTALQMQSHLFVARIGGCPETYV